MNEMFLTKIENYSFSEEGIDELKKMSKHVIDWPVVYILNGGLYLDGKALIPFLPLYVFSIGLFLKDVLPISRMLFTFNTYSIFFQAVLWL